LVRPALGGVLTIHKGIVFLTILVGMRESNLNILTLQVNDFVQSIGSHIVLQQVFQAMARKNLLTIIDKGKTRVQVSVISE
jgi:hypothetical protein